MTRVPASLVTVFLAAMLGTGLLLPAQDTQEKVDKIFDRIEESRGTALWQGIRELEDLGRGSTDGVRKGLTRALDRYLDTRASGASLVMVDRTTGYTYRYRPTAEYVTASAVKVDILATLLLQNQRAHRTMTAAQRADADIMIRYSDNKAADRLFTYVGGAAGLNAANRRLKLGDTEAIDAKCLDLLCWSLTETTATESTKVAAADTGRAEARLARDGAMTLADTYGPLVAGPPATISADCTFVETIGMFSLPASANPLMLNIIASTPITVATEVMSWDRLWLSDWLIVSTSFVIRERTSPWVVVS